jgi:hypothetical protein
MKKNQGIGWNLDMNNNNYTNWYWYAYKISHSLLTTPNPRMTPVNNKRKMR